MVTIYASAALRTKHRGRRCTAVIKVVSALCSRLAKFGDDNIIWLRGATLACLKHIWKTFSPWHVFYPQVTIKKRFLLSNCRKLYRMSKELSTRRKKGNFTWFYYTSDIAKLLYILVKYLYSATAWLAQSVEHETLNLRVVGSCPTLGVYFRSNYY